MQTKLTLRLDEGLIREAKSLAKRKGQSVSKIVADYFDLLREKPAQEQITLTPTVKSLKGAFRGTTLDLNDYHRYLLEKYL